MSPPPPDDPCVFHKLLAAVIMMLPGSKALHSSFPSLHPGNTLESCTPCVKVFLHAFNNLSWHTAMASGYFLIHFLPQSILGMELIWLRSHLVCSAL